MCAMNRGNILMALDDAEVQSLADQCHAAMTEFANALSQRDLILAAVLRAEAEGEFSISSVAANLTRSLAEFSLRTRDVRDYGVQFEEWLATEHEELGEVRTPSINFQ